MAFFSRERLKTAFQNLLFDKGGNFAVVAALVSVTLVVGVGGSIDLSRASNERERMQRSLDAGVLAAVKKTALADQRQQVIGIFTANFGASAINFDRDLSVTQNADSSVTARLAYAMPATFVSILGKQTIGLAVRSSAIALKGAGGSPCIYVLGSSGQDVLINSGADVQSSACKLDLHSSANPAFIMNSGSAIKLAEFCVKGEQYIKNGGTLTNLKTACASSPDPFAGALPQPTVSNTCTTSGYFNTSTVTMSPGVHCDTGFNGSPTITFKPGLHIIKGRMIINSGATVIADGVTFYLPDTNSEIRANGALSFTAKAPTSGTYKGILMFENTSSAANNADKVQYIFNGSRGETLEGIIYLPNRNVVYNSTTNVAARITMVVNQIIMNSAKWLIEPYETGGSSTAQVGARLTE